jgi:hypothetical protein
MCIRLQYPRLQYHRAVSRHSIFDWLAFCAGLLPIASCVSAAVAQTGASVPGAAHFATVAPPTGSVTPRTWGVAPPTGALPPLTSVPRFPAGSHNPNGQHHFHHPVDGIAYYPYPYPVAVTYGADDNGETEAGNNGNADDPANADAFDPSAQIADSYPPSYQGPLRPAYAQHYAAANDPSSDVDPDPPQPATTLVFKDGHQLEVQNYAIVGQMLYDLTPGHRRNVPLAELDLPSTEKLNDDHGVVFQLPLSGHGD